MLGSAANADSFINSINKEGWYSDFVSPVMQQLMIDDSISMVKLGPLNINKTIRSGYMYFYIGENHPDRSLSKQTHTMLIPRFVTRYLLSQSSNVKEMLRDLRRESLMIIVNYQFGLKSLEKIN